MKKVILVLLVALFIMPSMAMAVQVWWGSTKEVGPIQGSWNAPTDWWGSLSVDNNRKPIAGDDVLIYNGTNTTNTVVATCVLDVATPTVTNIRMYNGADIDIKSTGALTMNGVYYGCYAAGDSADMIIRTGGSYENLSTAISSPTVRLGWVSGAAATITMEAGSTFKAMGMKAAYATGSTGKINLFGGDMTLGYAGTTTWNSNGMLYLNANGKMELRDTGRLIMFGDRTTMLSGWTDEITGVYTNGLIANGFMYTNQEGKWLDVTYNGTDTIVTVVPEPATVILLGLGGLLLRKKRIS